MKQFIQDLKTPLSLARLGKKIYNNAQYLTAVMDVDPNKMAKWLPAGMALAKPYRADLFCAYFPDNVYTDAYRGGSGNLNNTYK